jgi:hypothetical protein
MASAYVRDQTGEFPFSGFMLVDITDPNYSAFPVLSEEPICISIASYVWVVCNYHSFMSSSYVRDQPVRLWRQLMYVIKVANFHLVALCYSSRYHGFKLLCFSRALSSSDGLSRARGSALSGCALGCLGLGAGVSRTRGCAGWAGLSRAPARGWGVSGSALSALSGSGLDSASWARAQHGPPLVTYNGRSRLSSRRPSPKNRQHEWWVVSSRP